MKMPWTLWATEKTPENKGREDDPDKSIVAPLKNLTTAHHEQQHAKQPSLPRNGFTTTQTITACILTTTLTLVALRTYKLYLRRIPNVSHLKPSHLRSRSLYGYVHSVGDGDNFRFFHTPGGRLLGWGMLPTRRAHLTQKRLPEQTIHVRIAGVDAPECAHFGREAQPYSQEALDWLRGYLAGRYVRIWPWRKDQYERVVCTVYTRRWGGLVKRDVGEEMLKAGVATVYEAKFGSEFGDKENAYRMVEQRAKQRGIGMWASSGIVGRILGKKSGENIESPREYKTRMKKDDMAK